jgi:hypothetical protein
MTRPQPSNEKPNQDGDTAAVEHAAEGTSPVRTDSDARDMRAAYAQPYVYRSKLKWYILHPGRIEEPQLHQARWWWRASVFQVDGVHFVGNGNHRGIQVKGASHRRGVEHFFAIASIRSCAKRVGRRGLRVTKNRRGTGALSALGRNEERVGPEFALRRSKSRGYG